MIMVTYGSYVYGTESDKSDLDVINVGDTFDHVSTIGKISFESITAEHFQQMLDENKIKALEVFFHKEQALIEAGYKLTIDLQKLRTEISSVASNSWVKAKKKIEVEKDYYIGQKSLFHSLRILMFGIQVAKTGRISNFSCANHYFKDIVREQNTEWLPLKEKYQPIYNALSTEFKKLAPK